MLLPTEEETAMSPNPFLATMTEVMRSGMEVPAARKVRPITWEKAVQHSFEFMHPSRLSLAARPLEAPQTNYPHLKMPPACHTPAKSAVLENP